MLPALAAALGHLPADRPALPDGRRRPRLAGRGRSPSAWTSSTACMQTRLGRHGVAFTGGGRLQCKNARHARSDEPVDPDCRCPVCARHSRGYLRHLFQVGEPTAGRLLSLHNLAWTLG